jgi:hypothetical protein
MKQWYLKLKYKIITKLLSILMKMYIDIKDRIDWNKEEA